MELFGHMHQLLTFLAALTPLCIGLPTLLFYYTDWLYWIYITSADIRYIISDNIHYTNPQNQQKTTKTNQNQPREYNQYFN